MRRTHILLSLMIATGPACSGTNGLGGASSKKKSAAAKGSEADSSDADDEAAKSGQPQQVAGAFLVGCAPVTTEGPQDPAKDTLGCAVLSKASGKKYTGVTQASAVMWMQTGPAVKAGATMADQTSHFSFYLAVAKGAMASMKSMTLHTMMMGNALVWNNVRMHEPDSDPATWLGQSLGANTGNTAGDGGSNVAAVTGQMMFLSSAVVSPGDSAAGSFNSVAKGDAVCAALAKQASLPGTWVALLSDDATDAQAHVVIGGPVTDMAGNVVAKDAPSFWGPHDGVVVDETGKAVTDDAYVWTGTSAGGVKNDANCSNWTSNQSLKNFQPEQGKIGKADSKGDTHWLEDDWGVCGSDGGVSLGHGGPHHLYCVSLPEGVKAPATTGTLGTSSDTTTTTTTTTMTPGTTGQAPGGTYSGGGSSSQNDDDPFGDFFSNF